MSTFKIAWRNLWRNSRRSSVTIAAMTLALWVELLYSGLVTGFMQGMERDLLDLEVGDMQVFAPGYRSDPSIYTSIEDVDGRLAALASAGFAASPRLLGGGLVAAGQSSAGAALRGVDVARDREVSLVGERVGSGAWLDSSDPHGVVIGRRLAKTLGVKVDDELVFLAQAADGSMGNDLYTVRGILLGVADGTDRSAVFMLADAFRDLLSFPQGVHQIIVRRPQTVPLDVAAARVRSMLPELEVKTWRELMPVIANMLESTQGLMLIVFFVIYIAVAIVILNAMLMAVFERIREFGVLKALGMEPLQIVNLIFTESAMQSAIAIAVGVTSALPLMWYLSEIGIDVGALAGTSTAGIAMRPIWKGVYSAATISGPLIMLIAIVFLAVLYPALKAAWIRPVEAMHHR
jgi:putative ABC transport system permease protein